VETPPVELIAEGIIKGEVAARHRVCPPGVAKSLVLRADLCGRDLVADGSDWVRVHAEICDARGTVCPFSDDLVEFAVEGDGRIIGDGDKIGANPARAEAGIATILVQAGKNAGKIIVKATAFALTPGRLEIGSVSQRS
jgi:beta-galactosidase